MENVKDITESILLDTYTSSDNSSNDDVIARDQILQLISNACLHVIRQYNKPAKTLGKLWEDMGLTQENLSQSIVSVE